MSASPLKNSKILVLTCMDPRLPNNLAEAIGLDPADCHFMSNAGGRAKDALRSIIVSQRLVGSRHIAIVHHTDCGMMRFTTTEMHARLQQEAAGSSDIDMDFLEFSSPEESVNEDVEYLKTHGLILEETDITGWVYSLEQGKASRIA